MGVLLLGTAALTACSAGQVNQTSTQLRDKTGPSATVGDVTLREVELAYPSSGAYAAGDDAELQMAVVNTGAEDDTLTGISGPGFQQVRVTGSPAGPRAPASPSGGATPSTPATGGQGVSVPIPADSTVFLGENGPTLTLVGLSSPLTPAQTVPLTVTFQRAGSITVQAPVATPSRALPRGESFNFEEESSGNEEDTETTGGTTDNG